VAEEEWKSVGDFERYLDAKLKAWPPEQRLAFCAAMAERWLHVYETFAEREEWGDPINQRHILDAVWNHLGGKQLSTSDLARYQAQVEDSMPHMDFTDDYSALAASVILGEAVLCCRKPNNPVPAMQASMSGFEALVPYWEMEIEEQPRLWQQITVRREFKTQLKLIEEIEAIERFDDAAIHALRDKMRSKELIGEGVPITSTPGPITITNQQAFEQYRGMVETDIEHGYDDKWEREEPPGSYMWAIMLFSTWSGRYSRRQKTIGGEYGQLADTIAQEALMAKLRTLDSTDMIIPDWGSELSELMKMAIENLPYDFDHTPYDQPHSYGPSFRRLWLEGGQSERTASEPWRHIIDWAHHRPPAWEVEDRRKKQGLIHTTPQLGALLARELDWNTTDDVEYPWVAEVDGERWQIRLNDFPDDFMYSLDIDDRDEGDFHDWPETWTRE
jgi:uncharacterized protein YjaG (DUF416 family)